LNVANFDVDADGEEHEKTQHVTIKISSQIVRQSNIREVAMEQLNKLLIEMERMNERVQGSSWRIKKYHHISADVDKTKPPRAPSFTTLPNKSQSATCCLINIE